VHDITMYFSPKGSHVFSVARDHSLSSPCAQT
jgi:hypothetical protein